MTLERDIMVISLQKEKEIERVARFESPVSPTPEHSGSRVCTDDATKPFPEQVGGGFCLWWGKEGGDSSNLPSLAI
jgi:hypothetical protein